MSHYLTYLWQIITVLVPVTGVHFYTQHFYQVSLWELPIWWINNYSSIKDAWAYLFAFGFAFMFFVFLFSALLNVAFLSMAGEKQALVYLGNNSKSMSHYYNYYDINKEIIEIFNHDTEYNLSFNDIYKTKYFIKLPGLDSDTGVKTNRFHPYGILASLSFTLFFAMALMGAAHALSYPASLSINHNISIEVIENATEVSKVFEAMLAKYNLGIGKFVVIAFSILFAGLYFAHKMPGEETGQRVQSLPSSITKNYVISAKPIEINKEYEKIRRHDDTSEMVDTGYRHVIFELSEIFSPPVYITYYFDSEKSPGFEKEAAQIIKESEILHLRITEDMKIQPLTKENEYSYMDGMVLKL